MTMYYIENSSTNPYFNLALEEYLLKNFTEEFFCLWRNDRSIIIGKHQNTAQEVNSSFVQEQDIKVVRRLSGGGAVYHDLDNINFSFMVNSNKIEEFDFEFFCRPVLELLTELKINATFSGRNDLLIEGKKFSGNSQYHINNRTLHHGTILYATDLNIVEKALQMHADKIETKGIKSIRSRVTNVQDYLEDKLDIVVFMQKLKHKIYQKYKLAPYSLTDKDLDNIKEIQQSRYEDWQWNYGASPNYSIYKERRVENCGKIEILMDVEQGFIKSITFYGDFFSCCDVNELVKLLKGKQLEKNKLFTILEHIDISSYFHNLSKNDFIEILLT